MSANDSVGMKSVFQQNTPKMNAAAAETPMEIGVSWVLSNTPKSFFCNLEILLNAMHDNTNEQIDV